MTEQRTPTSTTGRRGADRFFGITERGSTVPRELRGGLTTFVAMAYIVMLNPLILGSSTDVTGARLPPEQITTATAATAGVMTVLMGLVGKAPLALAAGLGVNAVVAFTIAPTMTWAQAFGLVVLEGIVIIVLAVSGLREKIINAIPDALKVALTVGIGLYIALIGLVSAGFVTRVPDADETTVPVQLGQDGQLSGVPIAVFCVNLLVMIALLARGTRGGILIGIGFGTVVSITANTALPVPAQDWGTVVPEMPEKLVTTPDFGMFGNVDLFGGFAAAGGVAATVFLFTLVLSGFFDAMGTITSVGTQAGLMRNGRVEGMGRILAVDGVAAAAGGFSGASPNTVFLESATGVAEGARTGLASVVTGALFCATLLFTPLATVVPAQAAAPALVVVGGMMMSQVRNVPWQDPDFTIPAFLTIAVIPFTYMITNGIGAGVIAYVVIKIARGKVREIGWLIGALAIVFALYFGSSGIEALSG